MWPSSGSTPRISGEYRADYITTMGPKARGWEPHMLSQSSYNTMANEM